MKKTQVESKGRGCGKAWLNRKRTLNAFGDQGGDNRGGDGTKKGGCYTAERAV